MKIPIDEIKGVYEKYKKQFDQIDKTPDSFFSRSFDTEDGDIFNTAPLSSVKEDNNVKQRSAEFFKEFAANAPSPVDKEKEEAKKNFFNKSVNEL